jgi:uncharacterized membrane protein YkgB
VYGWFGLLKLFNTSPANPLVANLLERTLPFISFEVFIIWFGLFELIIGLLFLWPKYQKLLVSMFSLHMLMTAAPLMLLPSVTWQGMLTPTLEGQYIIKNIVIVALALTIMTQRQK